MVRSSLYLTLLLCIFQKLKSLEKHVPDTDISKPFRLHFFDLVEPLCLNRLQSCLQLRLPL